VEIDRPAMGEELRLDGEETVPRQAATVILLRGGADALEVLLVRRTPKARFMGGVWVFPGGAVDTTEGDGDAAHRIAAIRELQEEAAIVLDDPHALVKFSRWITPREVRIRFDTHFFLAPAPAGQEPRVDGDECVDWGWFAPGAALDAATRDEIELVFPTIKHLEQLAGFASADAVLDYARGRDVHAVVPRVVTEGEVARIVLPDDPAAPPAGGSAG
jgi:8-oxo-dGTP pyrophosphatase MutT (NUDIX family)